MRAEGQDETSDQESMTRKLYDTTPTELALLRQLWKHGASTIRELTDRLYPEGTHAQYTTVQSLLGRLGKKGMVRRERRGRVNVFAAVATRRELIGRQLRTMADRLCNGSMAPLLSHLVQEVDLSEAELRALEGLVERLDRDTAADEEPT